MAIIMRQLEIFDENGYFWKKSIFEMGISSKKGSRDIVTSFSQTKTIVKVYFTILDVFKISSLE